MSSGAEEFSIEFSFGIDNGELDGIADNQIFVLGFELGLLWQLCKSPQRLIAQNIRIENKDRVERLLRHYGREFRLTYMQNDASESWLWLESKGAQSC